MTLTVPSRNHYAWTEAEDAELAARHAEPLADLAAAFRRTPVAVDDRLHHLCLPGRGRSETVGSCVEPVQAPCPLRCPKCGGGIPPLYEDPRDHMVSCRTDGATYPGPLDPTEYAAWIAPFRSASPQGPIMARRVTVMTTTPTPPALTPLSGPPVPPLIQAMAAEILATDPRVGAVPMQAWVRAHGDALTALEEAIGGVAIDRRYTAVRLLGLPCKPGTYHSYRQPSHQAAPEAVGGTVAPSGDVSATPTPEPPSAATPAHAAVENGPVHRIDLATFRALAKTNYTQSHATRRPHEAEIVALAVEEGVVFPHPEDRCRGGHHKGPRCPWDALTRRLNVAAAEAGWDWHYEAAHVTDGGVWSLAVAKVQGPGRTRRGKA